MIPSCRGPVVFNVSLSPSMEYSHCKPFSMKVFDLASSLFSFSMKFPVTWFFTAVSNEETDILWRQREVQGKGCTNSKLGLTHSHHRKFALSRERVNMPLWLSDTRSSNLCFVLSEERRVAQKGRWLAWLKAVWTWLISHPKAHIRIKKKWSLCYFVSITEDISECPPFSHTTSHCKLHANNLKVIRFEVRHKKTICCFHITGVARTM